MNTLVSAAAVTSLALASSAVAEELNHGYKSSAEFIPRGPSKGAVFADSLLADSALPERFDWRDVNGRNFVVADWNQHLPQYCGACWIHGTLSALNDRIKIQRGAQFPDVMLGRQSIMNCVPAADGEGPPPGCNGGDAVMIHKYMSETKVPDESCMPYQGRNMGCNASTVCRNCFPSGECWAVDNFIGYGVGSYGNVSGELAMMKEIYARGPIACSFATDDMFVKNYSEIALQHEGVYVTRQNKTAADVDHVMEVAGWGTTPSGVKYWVLRNSWGSYWGQAGWAKLERGVNALMSESQCDWAVPTFEGLDVALGGAVWGDYVHGMVPLVTMETRAGLAPVRPSWLAEENRPEDEDEDERVYSDPTPSNLVVAAVAVAGALACLTVSKRPRDMGQPPLLG